jgi:hypothetical protein
MPARLDAMNRRAPGVVLFCVSLAAASCQEPSKPTTGNTVAETLTNFGLVGVWRRDCDALPSDENPQVIFTTHSDGSAFVEYQASIQHFTKPIHDASIDDAGHLHVQYVHRDTPLNDALRKVYGIDSTIAKSDQVTDVVWAMQSGDRLLSIELSTTFTSGGRVVYLVKDGYLLDERTGKRTGRPTTDYRCSG